jgi:hypothetical protein
MRLNFSYDIDQKGHYIRVEDVHNGTLFTMDYDGILMNDDPLVVGMDII